MGFLKLSILVLVIFGLSACDINEHLSGDHSPKKAFRTLDAGGLKGTGVLSPEELSFQNIKTQILEPHCINCHTGKHKSYEMYSIVRLSSNDILDRISTTSFVRRMPAGRAALDPNLIQLFKEWVSQGVPEFAEPMVIEPNIDKNEIQYSFSDIKEFVFKPNNCFECHSHFDDYQTTLKNLAQISSTIQTDRMPYPIAKGGDVEPLTSEQKKMWLSWVNQGAPLFVGKQTEVIASAEDINWFSIRNNILGPKCILCHNSFGRRGPNDMSTYESLMTWFEKSPELFDTTDPENSHFIGSILGRVDSDEFFFDPMPFDSDRDDVGTIPPVTDPELEALKEWIGKGLPKN